MKAESIKTYTRRITFANKSEIIVIIYDIIEENLTEAEEALEKGDREGFKTGVRKAVTFVNELLVSLDMTYPISNYLARLYIYSNKCLNFALVSGKKEEISEAKQILGRLGDSFKEVAKTDKSSPLMENAQKVYAGITYGKGLNLDETTGVENTSERGFRA